jgi:quinol monooxygenase YgiN
VRRVAPSLIDKPSTIARIKAKPGKEERTRSELRKLLAPTRREAGCLNYDMHQSTEDPALFVFHENWTSEEQLAAHLGSPHIRAWFVQTEELLAEPVEIVRCRRVE